MGRLAEALKIDGGRAIDTHVMHRGSGGLALSALECFERKWQEGGQPIAGAPSEDGPLGDAELGAQPRRCVVVGAHPRPQFCTSHEYPLE